MTDRTRQIYRHIGQIEVSPTLKLVDLALSMAFSGTLTDEEVNIYRELHMFTSEVRTRLIEALRAEGYDVDAAVKRINELEAQGIFTVKEYQRKLYEDAYATAEFYAE